MAIFWGKDAVLIVRVKDSQQPGFKCRKVIYPIKSLEIGKDFESYVYPRADYVNNIDTGKEKIDNE